MADIDVKISDERLRGLIAGLAGKIDEAVQDTGRQIEQVAKGRAPVDTGNLRNTIQYAQDGQGACSVAVGAEYGIYVELGTRHMAARPYLFNSALEAEADLKRRLSEVLKP